MSSYRDETGRSRDLGTFIDTGYVLFNAAYLLFVTGAAMLHVSRLGEIPFVLWSALLYSTAVLSTIGAALELTYILVTDSAGTRAERARRFLTYNIITAISFLSASIVGNHYADCNQCAYVSDAVRREDGALLGLLAYARINILVTTVGCAYALMSFLLFGHARRAREGPSHYYQLSIGNGIDRDVSAPVLDIIGTRENDQRRQFNARAKATGTRGDTRGPPPKPIDRRRRNGVSAYDNRHAEGLVRRASQSVYEGEHDPYGEE